MYNHRIRRTGANGKIYFIDGYNCSTYKMTMEHERNECCSHQISTKALRQLLLEAIRTVSVYAIQNEAEFVRKVREASSIQQEASAKELRRKVQRAKKRCKELDRLLKKLYESYVLEDLPEKRYKALSELPGVGK